MMSEFTITTSETTDRRRIITMHTLEDTDFLCCPTINIEVGSKEPKFIWFSMVGSDGSVNDDGYVEAEELEKVALAMLHAVQTFRELHGT